MTKENFEINLYKTMQFNGLELNIVENNIYLSKPKILMFSNLNVFVFH